MPERRVRSNEDPERRAEIARGPATDRSTPEDALEAAVRSIGGILVPLDNVKSLTDLEDAINNALIHDATERILRTEEP